MEKYLRQVMTNEEIDLALSRIVREIIQNHVSFDQSVIVGSRRRGVPLAAMFHEKLTAQADRRVDCGSLDITFYRNDFSLVAKQPLVHGSDDPGASRENSSYGRSRRGELEVLVDRTYCELLIQPDYVELQVQTTTTEVIEVLLPPVVSEHSVSLYPGEVMQHENCNVSD